ncbi:hypothetical protein BCR34DRAFT_586305 [Clohesyomyces aquaticus]|uniref:Uncharacterized protein n=1 Tax=Clohesyomyces aquaticus TaxID=1231657 RepID=A0A1Y1ZVB0_9PLEO|nr:hypothetical protein BCR34DRAFT_586305 [Clohesyomyces aquaticus]
MKLRTVVIALSATGAFAQLPGEVTNSAVASVLSVLATAIPPESISQALQNPDSFASALSSELLVGSTPGWFQSLPADVKSILPQLYPAQAAATTTDVSSTPSASASATVFSSRASISASSSGSLNSTAITSVNSPTLSATGGKSSAASTSAVSTGGASYPTAVVGAGIAGAIGFLGMLAM